MPYGQEDQEEQAKRQSYYDKYGTNRGYGSEEQKYRSLGQETQDAYGKSRQGADQRYGELSGMYKDQYAAHQKKLQGPSRLGSLYEQRQGGNDPYSKYMMDAMAKSNADQFAARGMANSGMSMEALAKGQAQFAAEQANQQAGLAGGADAEDRARMDQEQQGFQGLAGLYGRKDQYDLELQDRLSGAKSDAEKNAIMAEYARKQQAKGGMSGLGLAGAAAGAYFGGPAGAGVGYQMGNAADDQWG